MEVDLTPTPTSTQSPNDTEIDTPPFTIKPLSYSYANSKHPHPPPPPIAAAYKECMKNHAAAIGGHAVDGCGEFMPSPSSAAASLTCAACGCHRNFHRRDPESPTSAAITPPFLDFRHPPLPKRFSLSPSPPPAPARLFYGVSAEDQHPAPVTPTVENSTGRKRFRTKFSNDQKEKMLSFSRKLGWKMQKSDEAAVKEFCHEVGVPKGVLKVWMHNNKNTFTKKDSGGGGGGGITTDSVISYDNSSGADERRSRNNNNNGNTNSFENENSNANANANANANGAHFHTHGCSSSSPP